MGTGVESSGVKVTGNRFQAVHWAAKAGQILGYCAIAFGIAVDSQVSW